MADRVKIVDIQVNCNQAVQAIAQYNTLIDQEREKQKTLKKGLDDGKVSQQKYALQVAASKEKVKAYGTSVSTLSRQVQTTINVERQQVGSLNQLRSILQQATRAYDKMSAAERNSAQGQELKAKINVYTNEVRKAENETQRFYRNAGQTSQVAKGFDELKSKVSGVGRELAILAGATSLSQLGKNVVEITRQFDDGMARVQSVLNTDQYTIQQLTDKARELGRTTMFHATDAAQAMENLARGGFEAEESLNAVTTSLQLAQANAVDLDTSSDILIRTMRGFGLPVDPKELTHAADVLSATAAKSATNITEVGEALKNAAPPASALKIPIEEINAALMVLADRGVRGSDAGTAMRMLLLGIANPTSKAGAVFAKYGIQVNQAELATKGLAGVLEEINSTGIMKGDNFLSELSTIFGRKAVMNVVSIMDNLDQYKGKLDLLYQSAGTNARMFDQALSKQSLSLYTLSSAWEDMMITMGESAAPTVTAISDSMTQGIYFVQEHFEDLVHIIWRAIEGFSLYKLYQHVVTMATQSAAAVKTSLAETQVARQESEAKTIMLKQQEVSVTNTLEAQKNGKIKLSEQEITLLKQQQANLQKRIATEKANHEKLVSEEVKLKEQANAYQVGTFWQRSMTTAKMAVVGFGASMKAIASSIAWMVVIGVVIEGVMRIVQAIQKARSAIVDFEAYKEKVNQHFIQQENAYKNASDESTARQVANIRHLQSQIHNYNLSLDERRDAINRLQSLVPGYHATLTKEGALYEKNVQKIEDYIQALYAAARARAAEDAIAKNEAIKMQSFAIKGDARQKIENTQKNTKKYTGVDLANGERVEVRNAKISSGQYGAATYTTTFVVVDANGKELRKIDSKKGQRALRNQKWISGFQDRIKTRDIWDSAADESSREIMGYVRKQDEIMIKGGLDPKKQHGSNRTGVTGGGSLADDEGGGAGGSSASTSRSGKGGGASGKNTPKTSSKKEMTPEEKKAAKAAERARKKAERDAEKKRKAEEKARRDAEKKTRDQIRLENKYYNEEGKAEAALIQETWASKRAVLEAQYNAQINTLKTALKTEKNLTENARGAINRTIIALETKKQQELAKLSDEELKDTISREQKLLEARLAIVKKGSDEEYEIRKQQVEKELELKLIDVDSEAEINVGKAIQTTDDAQYELDEALENLEKALSNSKAKVDPALQKAFEDAKEEYEDAVEEYNMVMHDSSATDEEKQQATNERNTAETNYIKATADLSASQSAKDDKSTGEDVAEAISRYDKAKDALSDAQKKETEITKYYADLRAAIEAKAHSDALKAEQEHQEKLREIQYKAVEERIALLQQGYDNMAILREQDFQKRYEEIVSQGRQEGETEEEYEARKNEALYNLRANENTVYEEQQQQKRALDTLGIDVTTRAEMDALQEQRNLDQQRYEDVLSRGKLESQTEEEYQQEVQSTREQAMRSQQAVNSAEMKNEQAKGQAFKSVGEGIVSVVDAVGENSKTAAKLSKILALAEIAINTGKAIAAMTAAGASKGIVGLPEIAAGIATIMANIATAITTVKSAKFAKGGKVVGAGTGTSDSIPANLSNGEYVMTAKATGMFEPLLAAMNAIGAGVPMQVSNSYRDVDNPDTYTESFVAAAREIRPVVSVEEITDTQKRVEVIQSLGNI